MRARLPVSFITGAVALALGGTAWSQCESATEIFVGDTPFDTAGSTEIFDMSGTCDPGPVGDDAIHHTIWFFWEATATDTFTLSTCSQATFDTKLAVLQASCGVANVIACLDDTAGCTGFTTSLSFSAAEGTIYYFAVGGYSEATAAGSGTLSLTQGEGGGGGGAGCGENPGGCCVAHDGVGCADADCCETVCAADPFCCETAWDDTCAGEATELCGVEACLSDCKLPAAESTEIEICGGVDTDGCFLEFPLFQDIVLGDSIAGTYWAELGTRDLDWYRFTIKEGTEVSASLYSQFPSIVWLVLEPCDTVTVVTSALGGCPSTLTRCLPPGTYYFVVGPLTFEGIPCGSGAANDYVLVTGGIPCDASLPKNDECDNPEPIFDGDTLFETTFASASAQELDPGCDEGFGLAFVQDIWFSYQASCTGLCTVSTCNQADFDTRLAAYTSCDSVSFACNDDGGGCAGFTSLMIFPCVKGETYLLRVGGFGGGGTGTLSVSCSDALVNDECSGAITVGNGATEFTTIGATTSGPDLPGTCQEGAFALQLVNDVWFAYQATCDGTVTVSACNTADYDTRMAAYALTCDGPLVACNDDATDCGLTSSMSWCATADTWYYIRVGGFSGSGSGTLNIDCVADDCGKGGPCETNDTCECAASIGLGDTAFNTAGTLSDAPTASPAECGAFGTGFYHDIWYTFTPTETGHLTVFTCNQASYDTRLELWSGCPTDGGVVVACNDDGVDCTTFTSLMEADVTCDTKYFVRVGSYGAATTGSGTLTLTLTDTIPCETPCPGDFNDDGLVDGDDLGTLLGLWGAAGGLSEADFNSDGIVDGDDLGTLLGYWGPCPR